MTLDDKVDLILDRLNGSEGSELRNDIQSWLPDGHANPVDNQLILDTLLRKKLIRLWGPANPNRYIINAKGRRINDKGGWNKYQSRKRRNQFIKDVITYANIVFGAINIAILVYSLIQDNRLENEVTDLRKDLEKQHEIRNDSKRQIDSLKSTLNLRNYSKSDSDQQIITQKGKP